MMSCVWAHTWHRLYLTFRWQFHVDFAIVSSSFNLFMHYLSFSHKHLSEKDLVVSRVPWSSPSTHNKSLRKTMINLQIIPSCTIAFLPFYLHIESRRSRLLEGISCHLTRVPISSIITPVSLPIISWKCFISKQCMLNLNRQACDDEFQRNESSHSSSKSHHHPFFDITLLSLSSSFTHSLTLCVKRIAVENIFLIFFFHSFFSLWSLIIPTHSIFILTHCRM